MLRPNSSEGRPTVGQWEKEEKLRIVTIEMEPTKNCAIRLIEFVHCREEGCTVHSLIIIIKGILILMKLRIPSSEQNGPTCT